MMDEHETLQRLIPLVDTQDPEAQHIQADAFEKIQKYYA